MSYKINVRQTGISRIKIALRRVNSELYKRTAQILIKNMKAVVEESKAEAESRRWRLAETIMLTRIDSVGLMVEGGCYAPYAGFPEFGTIKQRANPFWRPFVWNHYFTICNELYGLLGELYQ